MHVAFSRDALQNALLHSECITSLDSTLKISASLLQLASDPRSISSAIGGFSLALSCGCASISQATLQAAAASASVTGTAADLLSRVLRCASGSQLPWSTALHHNNVSDFLGAGWLTQIGTHLHSLQQLMHRGTPSVLSTARQALWELVWGGGGGEPRPELASGFDVARRGLSSIHSVVVCTREAQVIMQLSQQAAEVCVCVDDCRLH